MGGGCNLCFWRYAVLAHYGRRNTLRLQPAFSARPSRVQDEFKPANARHAAVSSIPRRLPIRSGASYIFKRQTIPTSSQYHSVPCQMLMSFR